ncbi:probable Bax inhibitor 1 [Corticium candelabrum]|uniref:probable Bax inhibitor 1 n=1 Tax=Corticium candelabrum TaxID=121492 RepID=UPI002E2555FF|nr:probable Bax inhibitor 1 [Corticium candelabrum]
MDALFGGRSISFKALSDFSSLDTRVRGHLRSVYSCLAFSTLVAAGGALMHFYTSLFQAGILSTLVALGCLLALGMTKHSKQNFNTRFGLLAGFSFFMGLGLGPVLDFAIEIDPGIIPTAFLGTSVIFVSFTLAALWAERRSYLFLGGMLFAGLQILILLGIANIFFHSYAIFNVNLYAGLVIMCAFVLYDTQLIVEKCHSGDNDYIWHSVDLFLDFINIFRRLVIILGMNKKKDNKKN